MVYDINYYKDIKNSNLYFQKIRYFKIFTDVWLLKKFSDH